MPGDHNAEGPPRCVRDGPSDYMSTKVDDPSRLETTARTGTRVTGRRSGDRLPRPSRR